MYRAQVNIFTTREMFVRNFLSYISKLLQINFGMIKLVDSVFYIDWCKNKQLWKKTRGQIVCQSNGRHSETRELTCNFLMKTSVVTRTWFQTCFDKTWGLTWPQNTYKQQMSCWAVGARSKLKTTCLSKPPVRRAHWSHHSVEKHPSLQI